jgi:hypothetical protein
MKAAGLLAELPDEVRIRLLGQLSDEERAAFLGALTGWERYADDPVGFVTSGLGEQIWSKQREILESVRDNRRTAVPAGHSVGKSHLAARLVAWWVACHPPGTARVVTTATTYRQVKNILWPQIRSVVVKHNLPGEVLLTEWKIGQETVADGFSPSDHNEAAVQGIHAEHLLIVVDEAGGISNTIGNALEALMTGGHTRLLLIGNPATNRVGSWFERACSSELYNVIPIPVFDTPNFTGEEAGPWARSLVDQAWVDEVTAAFGADSPFVQARVFARFPRSVDNAVIPAEWIDEAKEREPVSGRIRLGVDVAADGGDEFAIARADGNRVEIVHASRGNPNPVEVAGKVLAHIREAEDAHRDRGIPAKVRVKIDAIGVGWGVAGLLQEWGKEGKHGAVIVDVNVAQRASDPEQFGNQRAEMWWTGRTAIGPEGDLSLGVDHREAMQLAAPSYRANSQGKLVIEAKGEMAKRGVGSPDRAEAILLAVFEPPRDEVPVVAPLGIGQKNEWAL